MARAAVVPLELTHQPFTIADAARAGISARALEGHAWRRLAPGIYIYALRPDSTWDRVRAAALQLPGEAALSRLTAAFMHGLDPRLPARLAATVPAGRPVRRAGIDVRCAHLPETDVMWLGGVRVTTPPRTIFDLAAELPLVDAVAIADAALHAKLVSLRELAERAERCAGRKGSRAFVKVLAHVDGRAESPMETRFRMLLVLGGLPRPGVQVNLRDRFGRVLARADLYYPQARLCLEFDGGVHRDQLVADNRRQNRLVRAGYSILRFTAADVLGRPEAVLAEVRGALDSVDSAQNPRH